MEPYIGELADRQESIHCGIQQNQAIERTPTRWPRPFKPVKLHYHSQNKEHQKIAPATALLWIAPTRIPKEDHQEERQHRVEADKRPSKIFARMCDQIIRDCRQHR